VVIENSATGKTPGAARTAAAAITATGRTTGVVATASTSLIVFAMTGPVDTTGTSHSRAIGGMGITATIGRSGATVSMIGPGIGGLGPLVLDWDRGSCSTGRVRTIGTTARVNTSTATTG